MRAAGLTDASRGEWPSSCWSPSPCRVVRPAVQPGQDAAAPDVAEEPGQVAVRWNPNME